LKLGPEEGGVRTPENGVAGVAAVLPSGLKLGPEAGGRMSGREESLAIAHTA
jgi:hypothetical protein